jgi:acyl carrier protein
MTDEIRKIIGDHARLPVDVSTLAIDADLYQAGMTSHASVKVTVALEDRFDVDAAPNAEDVDRRARYA